MKLISELTQLYKSLASPLPKEAVQHVDKRAKGYEMTGYKYQYIVDRFNEVCGMDGWRSTPNVFEINKLDKEGKPNGFEVVIRTTIDIYLIDNDGAVKTISREGYGGHQSINLADAIKGAQTDSFKKTAAFFGVGADAYRQAIDDDFRAHSEEVEMDAALENSYPGDFIINFGKYANKKLSDVFIEEPHYVEWLSKKAFDQQLKTAAKKLLEDDALLNEPDIIEDEEFFD